MPNEESVCHRMSSPPFTQWVLRGMVTSVLLASSVIAAGNTVISIVGEDFHVNGKPTYAGRTWQGNRIEGLLLNTRMVQATFDDLNPETAKRWAYPDTGKWDAERNVSEFIAALPQWKAQQFKVTIQGDRQNSTIQGDRQNSKIILAFGVWPFRVGA